MPVYILNNKMITFATTPYRSAKTIVRHFTMKNLTLYIDLAFCVILLPVMITIFPVERWFYHFQWYVISIGIWLYSLYFINRFITVPYLFRDKYRIIAGISVIVVSLAITYLFSNVSLYTPKPNVHDIGINRIFPSVPQYQQAVWSLFMIVETFSFAVGLLIQTDIQRSRRLEVETERDKAEISLYKAQINPHFMFNTLNSLYGLFITKNENALPSLEKFISMMRYVHMTSMCDKISISDEADYIRQYVELQSLRLNEMTVVSLTINIGNKQLTIAPMLLVTFVENCFKYGVSPIEPASIKITLTVTDNKLMFSTHNRIFPTNRISEHMGIRNCTKRLKLLYPDRYELKIHNDGENYDISLLIIL